MAEKYMNPHDLCSKAEISYASYHRIMAKGSYKITTLDKIAKGLDVNAADIFE